MNWFRVIVFIMIGFMMFVVLSASPVFAYKARIMNDDNNGAMPGQIIKFLKNEGYFVNNTVEEVTYELLNDYDVYVWETYGLRVKDSELDAIERFVRKGGSMLIIGGTNGGPGTSGNTFLKRFGMFWNSKHRDKILDIVNFKKHPITENVKKIKVAGPVWISDESEGTPVAWYDDNRAIVVWEDNISGGKIVAFPDEWTFGLFFNKTGYDHKELASNIFRFLSGVNNSGTFVDILNVNTGNVFNIQISVKHNNEIIDNLSANNIQVMIENTSIDYFSVSKSDIGYNISFQRPRIVGNLTAYVRVDYNKTYGEDTKNFIHTTTHRKNLLFITDDDFWNNLYLSTLDAPVLRYSDGYRHVRDFIRRYNPNEIFVLGDVPDFDGFVINDKEDIELQFPGNGYMVIDVNDRKTAILGGALAAMSNYRMTANNEYDEDEYLMCLYECDIPGAEIFTDLTNMLLESIQETNYITFVNSESNISALAVRLFRKRNAIPIIFSDGFNSDDVKYLLDRLLYKNKLSKDYLFDNTLFIGLLGMPYGLVEDPVGEFYDNKDGDFLYTDNVYADFDDDSYLDASVGRFTKSVEIENVDYWDKNEKDGMIAAEYRVPYYTDLFYPGGMVEGFLTEMIMNNAGFELVRLVEHRSIGFDLLSLTIISEKYKLTGSGNVWIERLNTLMSPINFIRIANEIKYIILEYDWPKTSKKIKPVKLTRMDKGKLLGEMPGEGILFFFGVGNETHWFIPKKDYINPYRRVFVNADEIYYSFPRFIFDEHSLSGHPNSTFIDINNLVLIGSSGVVHNPYTIYPLVVFLENLVKNEPVGASLMRSKNMLVFSKTNETVVSDGNMITGSVVTAGLAHMKKEYYSKILYGDPSLVIDPPVSKFEKWEWYDGFKFGVNFSPTYFIDENGMIIFDGGFNILEDGLPAVPVYKFSFMLSSDSEIIDIYHNISWRKVDAKSFVLNGSTLVEKFVDYPEVNMWSEIDDMIDGRREYGLWFIPVKYINGSVFVADEFDFSAKYDSSFAIVNTSYETWWDTIRFNIIVNCTGVANLDVRIGDEEIRKRVYCNGLTNTSINWKGAGGHHIAKLVLDNGVNTAGPLLIGFELRDMIGTYTNYSSGYIRGKSIKTYDRYASLKYDEYTENIYYDKDVWLMVNYSSSNGIFDVVMIDRRMILNMSSGVYTLFTPDGWVEKGSKIKGDKSLLGLLNETIDMLTDIFLDVGLVFEWLGV